MTELSKINPRFAVWWRGLDQLGHVNSVVLLTYFAEIPSGTEFVETQHEIAVVGRSMRS